MTAVRQLPTELHNSFKSLGLTSRDQIKKEIRKQLLTAEEKQAKIFATSYEPSPEWWASNQAAYVSSKDDTLPEGFPAQVNPKSLWNGRVLIDEPEKWVYHFTSTDIYHLNAAYDHFVSLKLHNNDLSRETFPIPADSDLFKALETTLQEIKTGLGFRVLRGLPVDSWSRPELITIFGGVSAYLGNRLKQGALNVVHLRDITNLPEDKRPAITVKGQTNGNQVFHNDGSAGIVGLITLGVAETGGLSQLSSVAQTYNELARTRPDIVRELAKDDWVNKQYPEGKPLIFAKGGNVVSSYSRRPYFGFYEADPNVPPLSRNKHLALDAVHFTAERFSLDLDLQKGDLEFFNNLTVFHARTSSEDSDTNQRHLVRIWLENTDQDLPDDVAAGFARLNAGVAHAWPLEAWESSDPYDTLPVDAKN